MFKSTLDLFDRYYQKMLADNPPTFNGDLALEVKKRIQQLDFLYARIEQKQLRHNGLHLKMIGDGSLEKAINDAGGSITVVGSEELREMNELMFEIELYAESFYYLAGRMRTILTKKNNKREYSAPLPNLESFECEGARNVRNKLLEHAECPDSRVFVQNFEIGGDNGPTLKKERPEGQEEIFPDAGLYVNAKEIRVSLERLLSAALSKK